VPGSSPVADDGLFAPSSPSSSQSAIVDRVVDVEPLDGEAHLAGIVHRGSIDLRCHRLLRVDGRSRHDRRVVAAELQGQALSNVPRGTRHHFLCRFAVEPVNATLATSGWPLRAGSEVVLIDDDV